VPRIEVPDELDYLIARREAGLPIDGTRPSLNVERVVALNMPLCVAQHPYTVHRHSEHGLPERTQELVILRAGWKCGAEYVFGQHTVWGLRAGVEQAEIEALATPNPYGSFSGPDRVVIRAVDELLDATSISDEVWAELRVELDVSQVLELIALVGRYWTVAATLKALQVPLDQHNPGFPRITGDHSRE
jgi:alkylhydroperoxidase family enzyme